MSKTFKFDKAIEKILSGLSPHQRTCRQCQEVFGVVSEDIEFYRKFKVPPPTLCPQCRLRRRLGYRVYFMPIFYKKSCSAPGHSEKIIAFYSEKNSAKVYDDNYYYSDNWDALEFGKNYDFNKSFFEQFKQLASDVPHQSLFRDPQSVNCEYTISGLSSKNCYYTAVPYFSENVYYSFLPSHSRDCVDVTNVDNSEKCYESVYLNKCYNCDFCYECSDCLDSRFLFNCRNCSDCFGCVNLRNKQHCFFNRQLSEEEYKKKIKEINFGKRSVLNEYRPKFEKVYSEAVKKNLNNVKMENSVGNDLREVKNCFYCFRVFGEAENLRYVVYADGAVDSMDLSGNAKGSLCYESAGTGGGISNVKFSYLLRSNCADLEYCAELINSQYCFGCFGLKNKKYCVFNKQYDENEYWRIVDEIKLKMLENGEYGEFFPLKHSPFPYNDTTASVEFPATKEEIIRNNWYYEEDLENDFDISKFKALKSGDVPDDIAGVSDDILNSTAIICEQTGKPFRITKFELDFYRDKNLPLPTISPLQRVKNRFVFRHPFRLWNYPCSKCGETMLSGYDPEKKFKVYCEKCCLKEFV